MIRALTLIALTPFLAAGSLDSLVDPAAIPVEIKGHAAFCDTRPELCRDDDGAPVVLTPELRRALDTINIEVNHAIRYRADMTPRWVIAPAAGDCADFAVTKLARLLGAGLPRHALRFAAVQAGRPGVSMSGEAWTIWDFHMVLTIETDGGTLVLDSLTDRITPWDQVPNLHWIAIEAPSGDGGFQFLKTRSDGAAFDCQC